MNELTYLREADSRKYPCGTTQRMCWYRCFCGNEFVTNPYRVKIGNTRSCGCLHKSELSKRCKKHGLSNSPIYVAWHNMIRRCYDPKDISYPKYGGRGIGVCDRWRNSFENFYSDVSGSHKKGLSLDRYPNQNGNYEPSNFRWATAKQQALNKITNNIVEYNGMKDKIIPMIKRLGLSHPSIYRKLKIGYSFQQAAEWAIASKNKRNPISK